nr:hypothetical protein [uncultured Marinifilum sp.]
MKLLVNSSTLSGTGVVQVAVSFINECKKHKEHEFFVVLSDTVASQIDVTNYPDNFTFYNIQTHPRFLFKGRESRNQLDRIEKEVNPDAVFSVFGPSWWTPTKPHLMGYAYPHYVYSDSPLFSSLSPISLFSVKVKQFIHRYFLLKNGKYYVCETNDVNKRLQTYLGCSPEQVFTVTNTCNNFFNTFKVSDKNLLPEKNLNEFRFLSLCSFAPHKNLEV